MTKFLNYLIEAIYFLSLTCESAPHPTAEEKGRGSAGPEAKVDEGDVQYFEGHGLVHEVPDQREGEEVVEELGVVERSVEQHDVHHVVDAQGAPHAGVEAENDEETHVGPTYAVAQEVAVVVQSVDAAAAVAAMVSPERDVHVAGLALLPVRAE